MKGTETAPDDDPGENREDGVSQSVRHSNYSRAFGRASSAGALVHAVIGGFALGSAVPSAPDYLDRAAVRPLSSCSPVIDWS
jgi:hypothetical protein